jgi:hypothetical protein
MKLRQAAAEPVKPETGHPGGPRISRRHNALLGMSRTQKTESLMSGSEREQTSAKVQRKQFKKQLRSTGVCDMMLEVTAPWYIVLSDNKRRIPVKAINRDKGQATQGVAQGGIRRSGDFQDPKICAGGLDVIPKSKQTRATYT